MYLLLILLCCTWVIPPTQQSCWGGILVSLRQSVRPSVRPSRIPCPLCSIYSSVWILSIFGTNDHMMRGCVACDDPWPWPISSRSFGFDLENRVRSVAPTVLDGFFSHLAHMTIIIEGVSRVTVLSESGNFNFWQNFEIFQPWPWKKYLQSTMDSFHI